MSNVELNKPQLNGVAFFRLLIGWHFLYEGVVKLHNPGWTSKGYLLSSQGWFRPLFEWMAGDGLISMIDFMNIFCLMVVGLALVLGLFERIGSIIGIGLLLMYYLSHPPFPGLSEAGTEGSYWIVNKNLIEAAGLWVIYQFPTGDYFGIKRLMDRSK
ncbi:MAG: DoxX family membrane protein [Cyclobacteriaceae bacterium]